MDFADVLLWMLVAATLAPAHRAAWKDGLATVVAVLVLDAIVIAAVALAVVDDSLWSRIAQEDGVIEWATVAAFVGAAALHVNNARHARAQGRASPRLELIGRATLVLFCLFVAGEEISWGQRLFAFKPPDAFLERNYQQELNVHNVLMDEAGLGFALESKHVVALLALAFVAVLPRLVRIRAFAPAARLAPALALLPYGMFVLAAELTYPIDLTGEGAELLLGLLLTAAAACEGDAPPRRPAVALLVPIAFGLVTAPLVARAMYGADAHGSEIANAELLLLRQDIESGAATNKLFKKRSIHKRVFTAARDEYLALSGRGFLEGGTTPADGAATAEVRRDRRGYFLDPWNNPYWIVWDKERGRVALYSFGPNRLRDTEVRERDRAAGDDLILVFSLAKP